MSNQDYQVGDVVKLRDDSIAVILGFEKDSSYMLYGSTVSSHRYVTWTKEGRYLLEIETEYDILEKLGSFYDLINTPEKSLKKKHPTNYTITN